MRRTPRPLTTFALSLVCLLLATARAPSAEKLNVLFIIADDLRDTVHCYGNPAVKTPHLDRLAARGVRFDHAYAQYPVCNPSRTSFLTGMRCEDSGIVDNKTFFRSRLPDVVTLPQLLRQAGWHTASFGKVFHVGEVMGEIRDGWSDVGKSWDQAQMFQPTPEGRVGEGRNLTGDKLPWCRWGATLGSDDDQPDGQTAQHAVQAIQTTAKNGQPWMLAAGFHRPHDPFLSPKPYFDLYPAGSLAIYHDPENASPLPPLSITGGAFAQAFHNFTEQERQEFLRAYYAGVSFMDAQVGRLIDALDRAQLWSKTLVVFIGDHGYHHNERSWWSKNTLFERCCRVPCIIVAPGAEKGQPCHAVVELLDLYPTIADYCGLPTPPGQLAGQSLRPLLENPTRDGKQAAFTLVTRGEKHYGQSVRTKRWRYTQWSDGAAELYDHANDPQEVHNLALDPAMQSIIQDHQALLAQLGPPRSAKSNSPRPNDRKLENVP